MSTSARPGGPPSDLPPLLQAVQTRDPAAVEKILGTIHNDHQLEQSRAPRTENTALHLAAAQGSLQILKLLIPVYTQHAFGARKNLNAQNANRDTPLLFACARGHRYTHAVSASATMPPQLESCVCHACPACTGNEQACSAMQLHGHARASLARSTFCWGS